MSRFKPGFQTRELKKAARALRKVVASEIADNGDFDTAFVEKVSYLVREVEVMADRLYWEDFEQWVEPDAKV